MNRPLTELHWIQYEIADKLNLIESDPEDRPFRSKYEARENWLSSRSIILKHLENPIDDGSRIILESAVATFSYELSRNYAATEERPTAESMAKEALQRLDDYEQQNPDKDGDPRKEFVSVQIALRNTLGCIYCERSDIESAIPCLHRAEQLYLDYMKKIKSEIRSAPWELTRAIRWTCGVLENIDDRISLQDDECKSFEQLHTYTLYYLAQVYKQAGELALAAKYCQETLVRQLKSGTYDPLEWSINTATLAVYFMDKGTRKAFSHARRCLTAAEIVLESAKRTESTEKFSRTSADVSRCWAKYGLALLDESRERLLRDDINVDEKNNQGKNDNDADDIPFEDDFPAYIQNFDEKERKIKADFITNFPDARCLFLMVQRHILAAQAFYTLNDHATDYTELVQDSSRAYRALIFFEKDIDRKCKMHKRRIDSLVAVYKELSPTYYLVKRQQIAFELGEIYGDMLDLKIEIADGKNEGHPNDHQISKINLLARSGMDYFQEFLQSFKKADGDDIASKYDQNDVRPVVLAHFYCARFWKKILTDDVLEKLTNCDKSLREYRWIVDYVDRIDPDALERVKSEYEVSKEMVTLLPLKMDRMKMAAF